MEENPVGTGTDFDPAEELSPNSSGLGLSPNTLFQGGLMIGGKLLDQLFYNINADRNVQRSKDMFDYEHAANIADWRMNNEYNLPANQYARYIAAGMSPAAAMQSVSGVASNASIPNSPSQTPASGFAPGFDFGTARTMLDDQKLRSEILLNEAIANKNDADTYRTYAITPEELKNLQARSLRQHSEVEVNSALKEKYFAETQRITRLTPLEVEKLGQDIKEVKASILERMQAIENMRQQIKESQAREGNIQASTEQIYTQTQGDIWKNYQEMVKAFKADVTRQLVEKLNVNPDDPVLHQILESENGGNDIVDYLNALSDFSEGLGKYVKENVPFGVKLLSVYGIYNYLDKNRDQKIHRKLENMGDVKELLMSIGAFKGGSAVNPIGFSR